MGEAAAWSSDDAEVTGGEPFDARAPGAADHTQSARHHQPGQDQSGEAERGSSSTGPPDGGQQDSDQQDSSQQGSDQPEGRQPTSRQEAGQSRPGRPGRLRALLGTWPPQQWPLAIVIGGIGLSLLVVAVDDFRPGTVLFSGCLLLAALFRLVLPESQAGLLVLRSRVIDVLLMLLLGVCILLLAVLIPDLPEGGLPAVQQ